MFKRNKNPIQDYFKSRNNNLPSTKEMALVAVALSLIIAIVVVVNRLEPVPQYDPDTMCRLDKPLERHTVVLIDHSGGFSQSDLARMERVLDAARKNLKLFEKLSIAFLSATEAHPFTVEFAYCLPESRSDVSEINRGIRKVEKRYNSFIEKFNRELNKVKKLTDQQQTPLLEAMEMLPLLEHFDPAVPHRKLQIYSDLLQNSDFYSHYDTYKKTLMIGRKDYTPPLWTPDLKDIDVSVHFLRRTDWQRKYQTPALIDWWRMTFTNGHVKSIQFH